ncbi:SCO0930 family lipoprotein [Streptomyces sp. NPDC002054]|uniref:SCO0930 family lipoprotein n=1 Tax=Streptomyces sp. NPDC002054 TaxID=3154663 RepID=UPI00331C06D4
MKKKMRGISAGSAVAVMLLAAGCGSGDVNSSPVGNAVRPAGSEKSIAPGYGADDAYSGGGSGSAPVQEAAPAKGGPAGRLAVRDVPALGTVATDSKGFTLYRFDNDTAEPPTSACDGDCARAWPPVPAAGASAAGGIDADLLGEVGRPDGSRQLTIAGWPVYRYAKDVKAGDTLGEGVGNTWHAFAPDGKKAADQQNEEKEEKEEKDAPELRVTRNAELGNIITDGTGMTLYRFDKDSAWPMKIGCVGACLNTWKPAEPVDRTKVSGIAGKLVGTVRRPDGSEQLTVDCWPVYRFTGDKQPGDTKGHALQGLWFAVTDTGKKAKAGG